MFIKASSILLFIFFTSNLFATTSFFDDPVISDPGFEIEDVAGIADYEINVGLRNFVAKSYMPIISGAISLPIHDRIKLAFVYGVNNVLETYQESITNAGQSKHQKWSAINNLLELYCGIQINKNFDLSLMIGGGSIFDNYEATTDVEANYNNIACIQGAGTINCGIGFLLHDTLFNKKINGIGIRQLFSFNILGNGEPNNWIGPKISDTTLQKEEWTKNEFFSFDYTGAIWLDIPIHKQYPKCSLTLELGYYLTTVVFYKNEVKTFGKDVTNTYNKSPIYFAGMVSSEFCFCIIPNKFLETNIWITPMFNGGYTHYTPAGDNKKEIANNEVAVELGTDLKVKLAKIFWFKLDAIWTFYREVSYDYDAVNTSKQYKNVHIGIKNDIDPGITIGFDFDYIDLELKWAPGITVLASSETNIFNLANWHISATCKFPPPSKGGDNHLLIMRH